MTSGFVLLVTGALLGATPCESVIHGQVLDAQSGEPLSRTRIQSGEADNAVRSDSAGHFRLEGLCPGKVRLRAVRSDYALRELTLKVDKERQVEVLLFPMRVALGDELVVHAPRVKASDTRSVVSLEGDAGRLSPNRPDLRPPKGCGSENAKHSYELDSGAHCYSFSRKEA